MSWRRRPTRSIGLRRRPLVHALRGRAAAKPFATKNQLFSYEYMRRAVDLDMDPRDASDAQLKEHPLIVVGAPDEVIVRSSSSSRKPVWIR